MTTTYFTPGLPIITPYAAGGQLALDARKILTHPEMTEENGEKKNELTGEKLKELIRQHQRQVPRYMRLKNLYEGYHPILDEALKELGKPDNRLIANYAKYIVDTFNGYFIGIPVKVAHDNDAVGELVQSFREWADMEDNESEIAKLTSIYGRAYEYLYQGTEGKTRIAYNSPLDMFVVYTDDVQQEPLFAVRYHYDEDNRLVGEVRDRTHHRAFRETEGGGIIIDEGVEHYYGDVPVVEYIENDERMGAFESVETLMNALNKALSGKADDLDYFADAYLAVTGAELDDEVQKGLKNHRVINIFDVGNAPVNVEFLQKPSDDKMQESMIDRLIDLIYQLSMVANITDESFGNASGVALEFKLQPMRNMARNKERKFMSAMQRRYKMVFNLPLNVPAGLKDEWRALKYTFTQNSPRNLKDEVETARLMTGLTSDETALSVISAVENPQQELKKREEETKRAPLYPEYFAPPPTGGIADGDTNEPII